MRFACPHFRTGVALTALLAVAGLGLGQLPGLVRLGPLSVALLLGIFWRLLLHLPEVQHVGIGFSARQLLRTGIILLGVRLDFALIAHSGLRLILLDLAVVIFGLVFITWLGRREGLKDALPLLVAVGSSICGASAVAAAAPIIRARERDIALAIPLCSMLGTVATLGLTLAQSVVHFSPTTYGIIAGSTLHEVAQVVAASAAVPGALPSGTMAKLLRVLLLIPVVLLLARFLRRETSPAAPLQMPWFVGAFFLVGLVNTALVGGLPQFQGLWEHVDRLALMVANFLMAMAMAGLGLQVDLSAIRAQGLVAVKVAVLGWLALLVVSLTLVYFLKL